MMEIEEFYDQVMGEVRDRTGPSNPNNSYQFPDEVFADIVLEQMVNSGLLMKIERSRDTTPSWVDRSSCSQVIPLAMRVMN